MSFSYCPTRAIAGVVRLLGHRMRMANHYYFSFTQDRYTGPHPQPVFSSAHGRDGGHGGGACGGVRLAGIGLGLAVILANGSAV